MRAQLIGVGAYLPPQRVDNAMIAERLDTNDEWIRQRTGIAARRIAAPEQLTSDLATEAARAALKNAGIDAAALDRIIVATTTPDRTFPATAALVQAKIGAANAAAFDIQAVCSGFLYGLSLVEALIQSGQAKTVLLIGAETMTRLLDWTDRGTAILFGDGAGAFVFKAGQGDAGILATRIHSDGRHAGELTTDGGASQGTIGTLRMNGKEVFRHAVQNLSDVAMETCAAAGLPLNAVDWLVPHQANARIIEQVAQRVGIPAEKIIVTVSEHGNTSAASVPLAFAEAWYDGRIKPGQVVLCEAMGGGFTWGGCVLRI
jgi:3-oxoacyl-[acyl-carrier-protein] synthase-3